MVRQGSNLLQACKQMASYLAIMTGQDSPGPVLMEEAMGILQHHDAVSGTEKQHVANDYARLVHEGVVQCQTESQASYYQLSWIILERKARSIPSNPHHVYFTTIVGRSCPSWHQMDDERLGLYRRSSPVS